jgi:hypothetical protein
VHRFRAVLVAAILVATVSAGSAEARDRGCEIPRGYTVDAKTRYAVVYSGPTADDPVYGCLFSLGRRAELYDVDGDVTLAGRYVAYPQTSYEPDGTIYYLLTVFDLRRRRWHTISSAYVNVSHGNRDGEDGGEVTDVALKKNGSVAWISCAPIFGNPDQNDCFRDPDIPPEVWRTDRRGTRKLDTSAELGLRSLKRHGSTITWRHGSTTRTAQLK